MRKTLHIIATTTDAMHTAFPGGAVKTPSGELVQTTNKKGVGNLSTACHPSNGFRGALRRKAADRIMAVLSARGERLSAEIYNGLRCGAASAQPDTASNSIEEMVRASEHVYMGLFGGGARLLPSRYSAQDLYIICRHNVEAGVVSAPASLIEGILSQQTTTVEGETVDKKPYHYLERAFFTRVDDVNRGVPAKHINTVIDGGFEALQEYVEGIQDSNTKRKADAKIKKESLSHIVSIERIKTGTPVAMRFDFDEDVTDEQVGLLLLALQDMLTDNRIGGYGRDGYGRLRVDAVSFISDGDTITQHDDFYDGESFQFGDAFSAYQEAALDALAGIDKDDIVSFFTKLGK